MTNFSFSHRIEQSDLDILRQFTAETPVKVGGLASALGLRVVLATLPINISGLIQPDGTGFVVKINRFESKERQRFTIAHEIAHYLIHRDRINAGIVDSVLYRSKLSSRMEAEANRLAADIVMPSQAVSAAMAKRPRTLDEDAISELAEEFGVSKQAMTIRVG
ncbi:MAG: ImmA/IrrE family metallo-endopeptidase [Cytophagaceae bacterium]|jgi:Zn-dependent peptidase ImmA (M78 family)|nr:MAG: ImmA/IrrE family metallo-endopeptidase [Cytophagaceae bacterium]